VTGCRYRAWRLFLGASQGTPHVLADSRDPGVHQALPKRSVHAEDGTYEQSGYRLVAMNSA
jgi:hypothetical protein